MSKLLKINYQKLCGCSPEAISCQSRKDFIKSQLCVWEVYYDGRDIRDKNVHPCSFPVSLCDMAINTFSHPGELVVDTFGGISSTLVSAAGLQRNAVSFDLQKDYVNVAKSRLSSPDVFNVSQQIPILDDCRNASEYFEDKSIKLIWTSPPYADMLNREKKNLSFADNDGDQKGKVQQYSQDPRDVGTLKVGEFVDVLSKEIYGPLRSKMRDDGHLVINISDMRDGETGKRTRLPFYLCDALEKVGYMHTNTLIWNKRNLLHNVGVFGFPSKFITLGAFEYILHFELDHKNVTNWIAE